MKRQRPRKYPVCPICGVQQGRRLSTSRRSGMREAWGRKSAVRYCPHYTVEQIKRANSPYLRRLKRALLIEPLRAELAKPPRPPRKNKKPPRDRRYRNHVR